MKKNQDVAQKNEKADKVTVCYGCVSFFLLVDRKVAGLIFPFGNLGKGRHLSRAYEQRLPKTQPAGRSKGPGTSPSMGAVPLRAAGSATKTLSANALV